MNSCAAPAAISARPDSILLEAIWPCAFLCLVSSCANCSPICCCFCRALAKAITQAAVEEFHEFLENYPEAALSDEAKDKIRELREKEAENSYMVAQFYEKKKNYKAAKIYYQAVVDDFGNSSWSAKALKKIREMSGKE